MDRAPPAVPARLDVRDAVLRDRLRLRSPRRGERLVRAALPDLVPDRRGLDGRLARARDGVPPRSDPVRLHVRGLPPVRGSDHVRPAQQPEVRRRGQHADPVLHRRARPGDRHRGRDLLRQRALATAGRLGRRRRDRPEHRPDARHHPSGAGLRARRDDRRPDGRAPARQPPPAHPVHERDRRCGARPRGGLLDLRVHAEAADPRLLAGPEPAGRPVPVQPGDLAGRDRRELRRRRSRWRSARSWAAG